MVQTLGDEITEDICIEARDDLITGGDAINECIANWARVQKKLNNNNLKLSLKKVRVLLQDVEVYGHTIKDGKMRHSDHIVTSLGQTGVEELQTIGQLNFWKGLYKTLLCHYCILRPRWFPLTGPARARTRAHPLTGPNQASLRRSFQPLTT